MKNKLTIALLLSLSFFKGNSQEIKLTSQKGNSVTLSNSSGAYVSSSKLVQGKKTEDFSKVAKVFTMVKGEPALPVYTGSVIVPDNGNVTLKVTYDGFDEFDNVEVAPSKGSLKRNINPADIPYTFGKTYEQDAFYPGKMAEVSNPFVLRDVRGATVSFYPYQYNPVTKKLRVYKNISATVITDKGRDGINTKQHPNKTSNTEFNQIYKNLFLNAANNNTRSVESAGEMLIITPANYQEIITPLVDWKRQKGLKTTVAPLSDMTNSADGIKEYIQNFYAANPNLTYVLLIGDHENLPCYTYGINGYGEELWSDSYYAQLEGDDYFPEVLVGRFSGSVSKVGLMVNRTLEYEMNPALGDWMTKAAGIGSEEGDGYGDEGQADWVHLRGVGEQLIDNGYTYFYEFFDGSHDGNDSSSNPDASMISEAINEGVGLINYCGHGAQDLLVTGYFSSANVEFLNNNGKYPFVVSVACNNGTFTGGTSICEEWLRAEANDSPTGAIAACGSSILMAWAEPMQTQDAMTDLITANDPENAKTTLGELFFNGQIKMLESYDISPTAVEVMQTWVFFGDPSVVYRNKETLNILAEHAKNITITTTQLPIECDVEGAVVTIIQNGIVVGTGVVENGQVIVTLGEFNTNEKLTVTITKPNYKPYTALIVVGTLGTENFNTNKIAIYPNPAKEFITVNIDMSDKDSAFEVRDIMGKLVYTSGVVNQGSNYTIDTSKYSSGIYLLTITNGEEKQTRKFIIR